MQSERVPRGASKETHDLAEPFALDTIPKIVVMIGKKKAQTPNQVKVWGSGLEAQSLGIWVPGVWFHYWSRICGGWAQMAVCYRNRR